MLVLSRRPGEELIVDGNIRITVVQISGNRVKLGVTAPPEVAVHRSEVRKRLDEPGRRADKHAVVRNFFGDMV